MKSTKQTDKALYSSLTPRWQLYLHTGHATIRRRRRRRRRQRSHPPVSNQISNSRHLTSSSISVVLLFLLSAFISPPLPFPLPPLLQPLFCCSFLCMPAFCLLVSLSRLQPLHSNPPLLWNEKRESFLLSSLFQRVKEGHQIWNYSSGSVMLAPFHSQLIFPHIKSLIEICSSQIPFEQFRVELWTCLIR